MYLRDVPNGTELVIANYNCIKVGIDGDDDVVVWVIGGNNEYDSAYHFMPDHSYQYNFRYRPKVDGEDFVIISTEYKDFFDYVLHNLEDCLR